MPQDAAETIALKAGAGAVAFPVRWRRSPRAQHVSLRIDIRTGSVVVTLPPRARRHAGMALLNQHASWVRDSLAALAPPTPLQPGATVLVGGEPHRIRLAPRAAAARIADDALLLPGPRPAAPAQALALLQAEARRRIEAVAARHAATLGATVKGLRLKDTRSRWGSCAPDGTLAFSWRLVMVPEFVLDYVVAHEVAHLLELNHSVRFWAHVAHLTPHRDAAVAWLKANGPRMLRVG